MKTLAALAASLLLLAVPASADGLDDTESSHIPPPPTTIYCTAGSILDLTQCVANAGIDYTQAVSWAACTSVFQPWVCDQPPVYSPPPSYPISCTNDPAGWTACFVAGIAIIVVEGCPSMQMDGDWVQCVFNKEVDSFQWYEASMCAYFFQPVVCNAVLL